MNVKKILSPTKLVLFAAIAIAIIGSILVYIEQNRVTENTAAEIVLVENADNEIIKPVEPQENFDQALNQIIADWASQNVFEASVSVEEVTGELRIAKYEETATIVPASLYKIFLAYAVLHEIEQGKFELTTVTAEGITILDSLELMIINSDNDTAETLGKLLGWRNINELLKSIGIESTDLNNFLSDSNPTANKHTTASDLHNILKMLFANKLLNNSNTELLLNIMKNQKYKERIPAGLPIGTVVASKPGWLYGDDRAKTIVQNEAGIVYGPKSTYIIVVTTTGSKTQPLADLSEIVFNHLQK